MLKHVPWYFAALLLVCIIGFNIDVMDVDAAQYASMSREMLQNKSYLQFYDVGKEYLDKPPFLIWISSLSMKIFGMGNFAYRLPSFLFSLLALYSTYKFSIIYYPRSVGVLAALILGTCQAFFLMNHDVRTDTILMSCVIFSLWQFARWFKHNKFLNFLLGCVGIGFGMMTKGPIALIVPILSFGTHFMLQRNYKILFKWEYLVGVVIILLILLPMCIGLYQQFDMHPEKIVNGKTGVSGLRFYFWTQSFGRITGESDWDNNSTILFLLQNMLWSFLPWIFFFLLALFINVKLLISQKFKLSGEQEFITTGGFILTYLALGSSRYQLPHYIFVVFPLAAIITANFVSHIISNQKSRLYKSLLNGHVILLSLLWIALFVLLFITFENIPNYVAFSAIVLFSFCAVFYVKNKNSSHILPAICMLTMISLNLYLNSAFYPSLLQYQMGNTAGKWLRKNNIPHDRTFIYHYPELRSLHFYARSNILHKDSLPLINRGDHILTSAKKLQDLDSAGIAYDKLFQANDFHISRLNIKFLNPARREKELTPYAIVKIK